MNLLKLFIPKDKAKVITEAESWTVKWEVCSSLTWNEREYHHKVFINKDEALEFQGQLEKSADFIRTPIRTWFYKN